MKPFFKLALSTVLISGLATACGSSAVPKELVDARQAYAEASHGPALEHHPAQLHIAEQALKRAEWSYEDDGDTSKTRTLAYIALRKSQLADTEARTILASERKTEVDKAVKVSAIGELRKTRRQLAQERQARASAERRAKEAMDRLKESISRIGKIQEESRGTVITLSGSVLFKSGQSILMPGAQVKLDEVADAIKASNRKVTIEGHTDSRGKDSTNQELSEARAQSVLAYLVSKGVPAEDIKAVGIGASRPVADNATAEGRANNRRVEIILGQEKEPT
ncbi:MAG: OmpA family protein [Myxococcales bacterium]|nr:OmpA family protein [Myxococcales bacterium]